MCSYIFSVRCHISLLWSWLDLVFHFKGYVSTESIFRWVISLLRYVENRQSKHGSLFRSYYIWVGVGNKWTGEKNCINVYPHVSKKWHTRWGELQTWMKEARNSLLFSLFIYCCLVEACLAYYCIPLTTHYLQQMKISHQVQTTHLTVRRLFKGLCKILLKAWVGYIRCGILNRNLSHKTIVKSTIGIWTIE